MKKEDINNLKGNEIWKYVEDYEFDKWYSDPNNKKIKDALWKDKWDYEPKFSERINEFFSSGGGKSQIQNKKAYENMAKLFLSEKLDNGQKITLAKKHDEKFIKKVEPSLGDIFKKFVSHQRDNNFTEIKGSIAGGGAFSAFTLIGGAVVGGVIGAVAAVPITIIATVAVTTYYGMKEAKEMVIDERINHYHEKKAIKAENQKQTKEIKEVQKDTLAEQSILSKALGNIQENSTQRLATSGQTLNLNKAL